MRLATSIALLLSLSAGNALAKGVNLEISQSVPIKLSADATGVVVGSAGIADVIVHEPRVLILIGKSVGTTNVLVVGNNGKVLYKNDITVRAPLESNIVNVQRSTSVASYMCEPQCIQVDASETTSDMARVVHSSVRESNNFNKGN